MDPRLCRFTTPRDVSTQKRDQNATCSRISFPFFLLTPRSLSSLPHAASSSSLALPAPRTYTRSHRVAKTLGRSLPILPEASARGGDAGREPHAPRGARPPRFLPRPRQARKRPLPSISPLFSIDLELRVSVAPVRGFGLLRSDVFRSLDPIWCAERRASRWSISSECRRSVSVSDGTDRAGLGDSGFNLAWRQNALSWFGGSRVTSQITNRTVLLASSRTDTVSLSIRRGSWIATLIHTLRALVQKVFPSLTKIVGTLGPRSRSVEVIEECLTAGMSGLATVSFLRNWIYCNGATRHFAAFVVI
jgi:hypothetical protein